MNKKNGGALQQWAGLGRLCANRRVADHGPEPRLFQRSRQGIPETVAEEILKLSTLRCESILYYEQEEDFYPEAGKDNRGTTGYQLGKV
jgi:hypothetical protein